MLFYIASSNSEIKHIKFEEMALNKERPWRS